MRCGATGLSAALHWTAEGPVGGAPVILLHSLGSDSSMWRFQASALADTFRVIRVDTRGHGESPAPRGPYTMADLGTDILAVADQSQLDRFHLVGCSLGGLTALWLGIHHGDRLRSLTVANAAAKVADDAFWQGRVDAVRNVGLAGIRDEVVARFFGEGFAEDRPEAFTDALTTFECTDPDAYVACCAVLGATDLRDEVGRIDVPTLVVAGAADVAVDPAEAKWLHRQIGGSRLEILPGSAHLSNLDRPDAFTTILRRHLEERTAPSRSA